MKQYVRLFACLLWLGTLGLGLAQTKTITGQVLDENGSPLPGATIIEQGTTNGVTSDFDGNFNIDTTEGAMLEISFVGYETSLVTVGNDNNLVISLTLGNELDEVVLTALGLEKKKDDDLTGTSVVEVDQLQRSGESGVLQGLSGKAAGVQITRNSGDPGSGAYIQIRGQNTINGANSPLIVLDGIPISNDNIGASSAGVVQQSRLNDLNPEDIASVSVIKGAAAAALYGTGAANGVIVINTKRGTNATKGWSFDVKQSVSVDYVNREWTKQDSFGQGLNEAYRENFALSYGDRISDRSGGADTYDFSGGYFETPGG